MKRKTVSEIMLTLLLMSTLTLAFNVHCVKAEPTTWYVDDDGGADFTKIQDAIDAAVPGDTIYVYNGIYYEHLDIHSESLTIVGESKSNTVIDGGGVSPIIDIDARNVSLNGFKVQNGGQYWEVRTGSAILLRRSQSCTVSDNVVFNSRYGIASYEGKHNIINGNTISDTNQGILLFSGFRDNTLNETVIDNVISNGVQYGSDPPYGVQVWGGYNNTVVGNTISNISYVGISTDAYADNILISSNTISDIYGGEWARGIQLWSSDHNTVFNNTISNIGCGIWLSHYYNTVVDNIITNSSCGIYVMEGSNDNIIIGNTISNSWPGWASYGMNIYGFNNVIIDNSITNISYTGIRLNSYAPYPIKCKNNVVSGNIVSKTNQGIAAGFGAPSNTITGNNVSDNFIGLFIFDHSDDNTFTNNDVSNSYYGIVLFSSDDTKVYHNNFIDNTQQVLLSQSFNTSWDDGYPSGGNYWSDYVDVDLYSGPSQGESGSDGIWDHPYVIDSENRDRYPLTEPWKLRAIVDVAPETLNLKSQGQWITAYIQLPEGFNPEDIDVATILLNDTISPVLDPKYGFVTNPNEYLVDHDEDGILERMVKFDRAEVISYIEGNLDTVGWRFSDIALTITGRLYDGTRFKGTYTMRVIKGDVNGDGAVDILDLVTVALAWSSKPEDSNWNPYADINHDNFIDIEDLSIVGRDYGLTEN